MPEWITILISISSSVGVTAGGAWLFANKLIDNRLKQQLEERKGEIKTEVELELGEKAAQREYVFSAKKRLYSAIGPLKFQLLSACRDLALHIKAYGLGGVSYSLEPDNYYGKSTLYRILLPLVIAELIERQVAVADFSVDSEAIKSYN